MCFLQLAFQKWNELSSKLAAVDDLEPLDVNDRSIESGKRDLYLVSHEDKFQQKTLRRVSVLAKEERAKTRVLKVQQEIHYSN
jgi:hypothetical protein